MTTPEEQAAEALAAHVLVGGTFWDNDRKTTFSKCECGERCYHLAGPKFATHVAAVLAPLFAEERRKGAEARLDRLCNWLDAHDDSDIRDRVKDAAWAANPYRERADTYAEGGEQGG